MVKMRRFVNTLLPVCIGFFLIVILSCNSVSAEKLPTTISISPQPENPLAGNAFNVTGILSDNSGIPIGNKRVILEKSSGSNELSRFDSVAMIFTDMYGRYQFVRGNKTPAEFLRVRFMGNDTYKGSVSNTISVHNVEKNSGNTGSESEIGEIVLTGDPDKALIYLDGEYRGLTPIFLGGIATGSHILEIGKPGYQNQTMEVYVASDKKTAFSYTLPPSGYNLENSGIQSSTGLNVFSNVSYRSNDSTMSGDPTYSFSRGGVSFSYYGNESSPESNKTEVTTLYDEDPSGDGYSLTILITTDDSHKNK
jgi:hypothetical protein